MLDQDYFRVSTASLNTTPLNWERNKRLIQKAIDEAAAKQSRLLVLPELTTSGYGAEDGFFTQDIDQSSLELISELRIPAGLSVVIGLPVRVNNRLYNGAALVSHNSSAQENQIQGIYLKQNPANNGIHYEKRWFEPCHEGFQAQITSKYQAAPIPVGDLKFDINGISVGFEICEDAWVANRPGVSLFDSGVDIIVNPSASHFAVDKHEIRERFVAEGSRAFGAAYIYANIIGCESGRAIYDGGNMIASNGNIVAKGERLFFSDMNVITSDIDIWENRQNQQISSQRRPQTNQQTQQTVSFSLPPMHPDAPTPPALDSDKTSQTQLWRSSNDVRNEELMRAISLGLRDWLEKTGTNGFTLSLSGGADSALVAAAAASMVRLELSEALEKNGGKLPSSLEKFSNAKDVTAKTMEETAQHITQNLLSTAYQASENSGKVTHGAAEALAEEIGAEFHDWNVSKIINAYVDLIEGTIGRKLTWEQDDIPLQNIQARTRAPSIWLLANIRNQLLLTTSNLSELAVGYATQDGDTAGVLAPIAGVPKTIVRELNRWMETTGLMLDGTQRYTIKQLEKINNQQPTAELRPEEQTDEEDLMPFPILERIEDNHMNKHRSAVGIWMDLKRNFDLDDEKIVGYLQKYNSLVSRNQWKRDRSAPGFHLIDHSVDSRTWARWPLLNGGLISQLDKLEQHVIKKSNTPTPN